MCNINILINKNQKNDRQLLNLLNVMSAISYTNNDDADGCFFIDAKGGKTIEKSTRKLIYKNTAYAYLSHQRFSTGGENTDLNAHPFETQNHIIIHNGSFNAYYHQTYSDTYLFSEEFERIFKKKRNTVKTIQEILKGETGRYSLVIYNKKEDKIYYVKNETTDFYVSDNSDYIVASTIKPNTEIALNELQMDDDIWTPNPYTIYDFMTWTELGKVERPKVVYVPKKYKKPKYTSTHWKGSNSDLYDEWDYWNEDDHLWNSKPKSTSKAERTNSIIEQDLMELNKMWK